MPPTKKLSWGMASAVVVMLVEICPGLTGLNSKIRSSC